MTAAARRWPLGFALLVVVALGLTGGRRGSYREGLPVALADLLPGRAGRELEAALPIQRFEPPLRIAKSRIRVGHHGPLHPARAAARVGEETWVATPGGVLQFGPELWSSPERVRPLATCQPTPAVSSTVVNDILPAGPHAAFLATDAGIMRLERRPRCLGRGEASFPGVRVTAMNDRGLTCTFAGVHRGNGAGPAFHLPADLKCTAVQQCEPRQPRFYVGTHDRGLLLASADEQPRSVRGLEGGRVGALSTCRETGEGHELLAATTAGLFRVRDGSATRVPGSPLHATAALHFGEDLLVGSFDDGLLLLRAGQRRRVQVPGRVSLLFPGPGGAVLVGSDRGLFVWRPGRAPVRVPVSGPPPSPVTAIALDGESGLWAGTFDGGLAHLEGESWSAVPVFDARITSLHRDERGGLWVGTASGLGRLRDGEVVRVPDRRGWLARHVASLRGSGPRDPTLWVAVHPGLVALDTSLDPPELEYLGARRQEADAGLPGPTIYAVAPGSQGLWVGSDDGLGRVSLLGARVMTDLGGVLPDNWINDLRSEGETLVVLTLRSGLLRLSPSGSEVFASRLMTSPGVLALVRGRVLFGSNSAGLVVLDDSREGRPGFRAFGPVQGLPSAMVTSLLYDVGRDRLWVGGSAGLTEIDEASRSLGLQPAAWAALDGGAAKEDRR